MKRKRFSGEQIVAVLKQAEVGVPVAELIRKAGISEQTFYRWKKQYTGLGMWGLALYLEGRFVPCAIAFLLAAPAKETAILTPLSVLVYELVARAGRAGRPGLLQARARPRRTLWATLLLPLATAGLWYAFHYLRTGFVLGNPEFFRYNLRETLRPSRIRFVMMIGLWYATAHMNLFALTVPAAVVAVARRDSSPSYGRQQGVPAAPTYLLTAVVVGHVCAFSLLGEAALARCLLQVTPVVIILSVRALSHRVRRWPPVVGASVLGFAAGLFGRPPYHHALDDNLAYRDFVVLHEKASKLIAASYPGSRIGRPFWPGSLVRQ